MYNIILILQRLGSATVETVPDAPMFRIPAKRPRQAASSSSTTDAHSGNEEYRQRASDPDEWVSTLLCMTALDDKIGKHTCQCMVSLVVSITHIENFYTELHVYTIVHYTVEQ